MLCDGVAIAGTPVDFVKGAGRRYRSVLMTPRLSLEPLRLDHARDMASVLIDPALYEHIGGSPPAEAELEGQYARQTRGVSPDGRQGWLNWALRLRGERRLIGVVQATLGERDATVGAELAWMVARQEQGAGLATEAACAVTGWLQTVGVTALSAHIHPRNAASAAVAR
ncbi:MAG: GNAT family N-acetyltransferase, partial [Solirubrobacterales bacterium]|nr:GNAT family N-acetyltransferase [Solirubrobacterales bacterium]